MAARGRPSSYNSKIKPALERIRQWLEEGATEQEIYKALGVCGTTWTEYKAKHKELREIIENIDRTKTVLDLRNTLIRKARGYNYDETSTQTTQYPDGSIKTVTEIKTKHATPDTAAIQILLKNWDRNWYDNPVNVEIKKKELELKEKALEEKLWM